MSNKREKDRVESKEIEPPDKSVSSVVPKIVEAASGLRRSAEAEAFRRSEWRSSVCVIFD